MNKYFRTINNKSQQCKYIQTIKENENCHLGQKKLLFAEIEFLAWVSHYIDINNSIVLYIGSAPGHHINILIKLYPKIHFILYDLLPTEVEETEYITKFKKYYSSEENKFIIDYKKKHNKSYILFISDIRIRETYDDEYSVWKDMVSQQNWAIEIDADFISLKFRLPWLSVAPDNVYKNTAVDLYPNKLKITKAEQHKYNVLFIAGKIFLQIYPLKRSTETRLFCKKKNNLYTIKKYNCISYEDKLMYFNLVQKDKSYKFKQSDMLKDCLLGYEDNYDCVGEYCILYYYFKNYIRNLDDYNKKIINLLHEINFINSSKLLNKFNVYCPLYVYVEFLDKCKKDIKNNDKLQLVLNQLLKYDKILKDYEIYINNSLERIKTNQLLNIEQKEIMFKKILKYKVFYKFINKVYSLINYSNNKFIINIKNISIINRNIYDRMPKNI